MDTRIMILFFFVIGTSLQVACASENVKFKGPDGTLVVNSNASFTCTPTTDASLVSWLRTTLNDSEVTVLNQRVDVNGNCIQDAPDYMECSYCNKTVYQCTIKKVNLTNDGDQWRCSAILTGTIYNSLAYTVKVTHKTTKSTTTEIDLVAASITLGVLLGILFGGTIVVCIIQHCQIWPKNLVLYIDGKSASSRAVWMAAKAADIPVTILNSLEEEHMAQLAEINPDPPVPTLQDGNFSLWGSRSIMTYLISRYRKNSRLYPKDLHKRAVCDCLLHYDLGSVYMTISEYMAKPKDTDKAAAMRKVFDNMNRLLKGKKYMCGDHITIVDISMASNLSLIESDYKLDQWLLLDSWYKKMMTQTYWAEWDTMTTQGLFHGKPPVAYSGRLQADSVAATCPMVQESEDTPVEMFTTTTQGHFHGKQPVAHGAED